MPPNLPDPPLSVRVQLLLLIEQYVSQTNSMDPGFQCLFGVNFFINAVQ